MTQQGRLAENVMHFARVLRAAGLPIGPDRVLDAVRALEVAGVERRDDFYWTLAAVFLDRREQFEIYDQAFHIFWRDPQLLERVMAMFLHFLHAITNDRDRVTSFVFGTRLTNISRYLRHRDVDAAMAGVAEAIADWSGGTRIGNCLREFNLRWSRRVLGQNAVVLMISDGLDGDVGEGLAKQMERLHRSCRKLLWLNPLLRYEGFEARPAGVRAMLPHVDEFLPVHNVASLVDLARALEGSHAYRRAA